MKKSNVKSKQRTLNTISAITVIQPWAEMILKHGKNVENRQKNILARGYIAIHASGTNSKNRFTECSNDYGKVFDSSIIPFGAIVGFVNLVDVIKKNEVTSKTKKWFQGEFGLVLRNPIILKKPIKTKGARGSWTLKGKVLRDSLNQLTKSERLLIENRNLK